MKTIDYMIKSKEETIACSVDYANNFEKPSVICLHGGGPSSRKSTEYLAAVLKQYNKSVIRFDFSGQGDSSGKMNRSSLKKRYQETITVLNYFNIKNDLTIIGSSMGGYIASSILQDVSADNLVLFGPAAYDKNAWDLKFGSGFTGVIRAKNSFLNSDLLDNLKEYSGRALLFIGENDDIIPDAVVELYIEGLNSCQCFEIIKIKNCPHPIHRWIHKHPEIKNEIVNKLLSFLL